MHPSFVACDFESCYQCCLETRMPLLQEDIERIEKKGFPADTFSEKDGDFIVLKNRNGACVFLKKSQCTIYSFRPTGCRLYPLVFDIDQDKITIDLECPNKDAFKAYLENTTITDLLLDTVDRLIFERNARITEKNKKS